MHRIIAEANSIAVVAKPLYHDCDAKSINLGVNYKYLIILVCDN